MKRLAGWLLQACLAMPAMAVDRVDTVFPQQLSARTLMTYCASSSLTDRGRQQQRYCAGFVSGIEEAVRLLHLGSPPSPSLSLCVPANASARQFQEAFVRHAGRPGTDLDQPAALVTVKALQAAFPCLTD